LAPSQLDLFQILEGYGGRIVLNATSTGEFGIPGDPGPLGTGEEPLLRLARTYLESLPDAFFRPNTLFHDRLKRDIAARGVRGVILRKYVWCDTWHAESGHLREALGVPVMVVDVPEKGSLDAHGMARTEAFLEMLRSGQEAPG